MRGKIISEVWSGWPNGGKEGEWAERFWVEIFSGGGENFKREWARRAANFLEWGMGAFGFVKIRGSFF
jgi:hypothetical protein